ncbi:Methyltransferase domain-containing protein [Nakamurella panacisegetis]|uniref:Methyltransferase domain-containing protein n=1 Tax=Nakamurella panacisegetis TaxID=1090615 RepID=A0A1H0Q6V2_9ACTN|nr:class I SAM-dependent methyltransferase [Nakamurella panacisegetis]SDP13122.1 Methyltransferase domain-containing protein [Nakamurella panacisegetis]
MNAASRTITPDPVGEAVAALAGPAGGAVVIDVGGGSGTRAVPLARLGCTVLVVDASIDALAILRRRAADAGVADRITAVQADAVALAGAVSPATADLVLCHHLLETVDDPAATLAGIASAMKPDGRASVLVAGRFAAVLAQAVAGRYADAAAILDSADGNFGPHDPVRRRFDVDGLTALLAEASLEIVSLDGVGVVSGLVPGGIRPTGLGTEQLSGLEHRLAGHRQLREIATDLHAVVRLRAG